MTERGDKYRLVRRVLEEHGAEASLVDAFRRAGIDDAALPLLDDAAMRELGVPLGLRLKLRETISRGALSDELSSSSSSSVAPASSRRRKVKRSAGVVCALRWAPGLGVACLFLPIGVYLLVALWSDYSSGLGTNPFFAIVAVLYYVVAATVTAAVHVYWTAYYSRSAGLPLTTTAAAAAAASDEEPSTSTPGAHKQQRHRLLQDDETPDKSS
jgi:hypothetical protein